MENSFVPLIDRGIFEPEEDACIEEVIMPLMLARLVAAPPDAGAFLSAVERLHADIARHIRSGERRYPFTIGMTRNGALGIVLYTALRKADLIGLSTSDPQQTACLTLSPSGLHLFHGFLVFVTHSLHGAKDMSGSEVQGPSPKQNMDVARVQQHLLGMVNLGNEGQALRLFGVRVVDTYGRPAQLSAKWYPNRAWASWEWQFGEGDQASGGIAFTMEQAAQLSGFLTLLHMAFPKEWVWEEK